LSLGVDVCHLDVPQAYVKAAMDTTVYMSIPDLVEGDPATQALLLNKGLYGLKQSGKLWHDDIDTFLVDDLGYNKSETDPCLYYKHTPDGLTMLGLYVDDIIMFSQDKTFLKSTISALEMKYQIKTLGNVSRCLGINIERKGHTMWLEQTALIEELLDSNKMTECHTKDTPIATDHKMYDNGTKPPKMSKTQMQQIVGSLQWLASCTRPDIAYATNLAARYTNCHNEHHETTILRILRYLRKTKNYRLELTPDGSSTMDVFTDADWAGDKSNRKSTTGCVVKLNGVPIHWSSKQQATVALSTMEAEYIGACTGTQEALWLKQLLGELKLVNTKDAVHLWVDNQSALKTMEDQLSTSRAKHIDIKYHFIRSVVKEGKVACGYCPTDEMPADAMTKPLSAECLHRALDMINLKAPE